MMTTGREEAYVGCQGKNSFSLVILYTLHNKKIWLLYKICSFIHFYSKASHTTRNSGDCTCKLTDKPFSSNTVSKWMMCSSSVTLREICQHGNTHIHTHMYHYLVVWITHNWPSTIWTRHRTLGGRAFSIAAPTLWNSFPKAVRDYSSLSILKKRHWRLTCSMRLSITDTSSHAFSALFLSICLFFTLC